MMIEEEITLSELADRFCNVSDFTESGVYDLDGSGLLVETIKDGVTCFVPIKSFVVKDLVEHYYTDGNLNAAQGHNIIENGINIPVENHHDFKRIDEYMFVVDIEVDDDSHSYLANGRLNHNTSPGGKAVPFHSSIRARLDVTGKIKGKINGQDAVIGQKTKVKIIKNRLGPPQRECTYEIYYNSGIDDVSSWINPLKDFGIIKNSGAWYTAVLANGEEIKFQKSDFRAKVLDNPELKEYFYDLLAEKYIMPYEEHTDEVMIDENDTEFE